MGILDSLENSPAFKGALGQLEAAVVPVVLSEVLGNGSQGGLSAIVAKLQQAGLGDQVKSWIGNGQNLPITAEQLQQVLGSDAVKQLAARFNIPVDQLSKVLAQQLPAAVDTQAPMASSLTRPDARRDGSADAADSPATAGLALIVLKNLQNSRTAYVRM